jgi:hypothetical protein
LFVAFVLFDERSKGVRSRDAGVERGGGVGGAAAARGVGGRDAAGGGAAAGTGRRCRTRAGCCRHRLWLPLLVAQRLAASVSGALDREVISSWRNVLLPPSLVRWIGK